MTDGTENPQTEQDEPGESTPFSISEEFTLLTRRTAEAAGDLVVEGAPALAQIELLRTLNTGMAAMIMLQEGNLKATAYLIEVTRETNDLLGT